MSAEATGVASVCTSACLDWRDLEAWPVEAFDVALGADVIYEEEAVESLAKVLTRSLRPGGRFLLADGKARRNRNALWKGLLKDGAFALDGEPRWESVLEEERDTAFESVSERTREQPVVLQRFVRC